MPETPEGEIMKSTVNNGKGSNLRPAEYSELEYYYLQCPLSLSTGSPDRVYNSLTVNKTCTTSESGELPVWVQEQRVGFQSWPPQRWIERGVNEPWQYLLAQTPPGKLTCVSRGKLIVMAAGKRAVAISLGLEAHIFGMPPEMFWDIIANDIPGPNKDPDKSQLIRTYIIPDKYTVPYSSPKSPRTIKIFGAFVSEKWVHVISDFSGLVRLHVKSRDAPYTKEDFSVGSPEWYYMFESFKGGPDWFLEHPLAMSTLQSWRAAILYEWIIYEKRRIRIDKQNAKKRAAWNKAFQKASTFPIDRYVRDRLIGWSSVSVPQVSLPPLILQPPPSAPNPRPIIKEIATNSLGAFSGFGRHLANDFLYLHYLFPGTPSHVICSDDAEFARFEKAIHEYLSHFHTTEFLDKISAVTNSNNPFAFNETSNAEYMRTEMHVFRRTCANVPIKLYEDYCKRGLLDPAHTIGQDYTYQEPEGQNNAISHRKIEVYFYGDNLKAYSIIRAQCPADWGTMPQPVSVKKDVTSFGYRTTVGPAQFHEQLLNRIVNPPPPKVGRPAINHSGRRGRPPKAKTTRQAIVKQNARLRGRPSSSSTPPHLLVDDGDNEDTEDTAENISDDEQSPLALAPADPSDPDGDNCGDADDEGDASAHNEHPFIETAIIADEDEFLIVIPSGQGQICFERVHPINYSAKELEPIVLQQMLIANAFALRSHPKISGVKKPEVKFTLQKRLEANSIEEVKRHARKFNTQNIFSIRRDIGVPCGVLTPARAYHLCRSDNPKDFQPYLKKKI